MKLPQIRMESQLAKIQINQTDARLDIKQELPLMKIEQPHAEVKMRTTPSKLSIDQSRAWEDMNLMSILKRNDRFAREALQAAQAGMARTAREGNELMKIQYGGNVIASQAKRISSPPMKALGIKFIPSTFAVKIDYRPSEVHIDVTTHKPRMQAQTYEPEFTYHPGQVETSLLQRNYLNITYDNNAQ